MEWKMIAAMQLPEIAGFRAGTTLVAGRALSPIIS
jgi:hypothetical protein